MTNNSKIRTVAETAVVYITIYLLTVGFWMILPSLTMPIRIAAMFSLYIIFALLPVLSCIFNKKPLSVLGFTKQYFGKQILSAIIPVVFLLLLFVGIPTLFGVKLGDIIGEKMNSVAELIFQIPYTIIFVGFGEEILFRGYFLERIRAVLPSDVLSIIISSLLFGLWHFPASGSILQVLITAVIGAVFAVFRLKMKNCTTFSIGLAHGLYDYTLVLLRFFCV